MASADWEEVKARFEELYALEKPARDARLAAMDAEVAAEVASLLEFAGRDMLETPAMAHAIGMLQSEQMPEMLGPYRLIREIGRGGMATVYLAERADGQFQKQVAVKILRAGVYGDDMRRRFLQERQLLADLDHAHIVRLMDGGVLEDGRPYLIEDYVEGVAVTEYARVKGLDAKAIVALFLEVVKAVEYAHGKGIVHRDLKPANILVNGEGVPKLVDFGIARLWDGDHGERQGETETRYWTPAYASPEQANGLTAGPGSDVYSLGLILYELLTGKAAVDTKGLGAYEAAKKIMETRPDFARLPLGVREAVAPCLAKKAEERGTAGELLERLEHVDWRKWGWWPSRRQFSAGLGLAGLAGVAAMMVDRRRSVQWTQMRGPVGANYFPSISPGGDEVVYENHDRGASRLLIYSRKSGESRVLVERYQDGIYLPSRPLWSADGKWIAFTTYSERDGFQAQVVMGSGGKPRVIARNVDVAIGWTADAGKVLITARREGTVRAVFERPLDGGTERRVTAPPEAIAGDLWLDAARDGRQIGFVRYVLPGDGDVYVGGIEGEAARKLTNFHCWIQGVAFHPNGKEVLFAATVKGRARLWRVSVQRDAEAVAVDTPGMRQPEMPSFGGAEGNPMLALHDVDLRIATRRGPIVNGRVAGAVLLGLPEDDSECPAYERSGRRIAWAGMRGGERGVWISQRDGGGVRRVGKVQPESMKDLSWSPDGEQIAFTMNSEHGKSIWLLAVGTGEHRRLHMEPWNEGRASWSADGKWLYFLSNRSGVQRFHRIPWPGGGSVEAVTPAAVDGMEAPGGKSFLFLRTDSSTLQELRSDGTLRALDAVPPVRMGFWQVTGSRLVYLDDTQGGDAPVYVYDMGTGRKQRLAGVPEYRPAIMGLAVSPDLTELLWVMPDKGSKIWLAENFV